MLEPLVMTAIDTCATLNPPTPFPVACPGAESPTKVYNGEPLYLGKADRRRLSGLGERYSVERVD